MLSSNMGVAVINRNAILSLALLVGCSGTTPQLGKPGPGPALPAEAAVAGDSAEKTDAKLPTKDLKITFVDVGEGDAILIQVGDFDALIDTGNQGKWDGQLGRVLESVSGPLEILLLTHPHADHYAQADEVMKALEVERVITNGETRGPPRDEKQKAFFQDYLDAVVAEGVTAEIAVIGPLPSLGIADIEIDVLATGGQYTDGPDGSDINNDSLVLMLTYAGKKVLFAADIEDVAGAQLVAKHCGDTKPCPALNADVLKVPHHGSKHFDQGFFEAVSPRFAVISGGFHNEQHCLPRQESYQALKLLGAKVFSTSAEDNGDVSVVISPDGNMNWDFPDNPVFVWESQKGRKCVGPTVYEQGSGRPAEAAETLKQRPTIENPEVRIGEGGPLPKEEISRVFNNNMNQLRYCYEIQLSTWPDLHGEVVLWLQIGPDGLVKEQRIAKTTLDNQRAQTCMLDVLRTWRFPKPLGGGVVEVTYPVTFGVPTKR